MARPTKLTPEAQEQIVDAILHGATYRDAAEASGVVYDTFNNWMLRGKDAKRGKYFEFFEAVSVANAQCAVNFTRVIQSKAALGDWKAAEAWLKRRRREDWGDVIEINQKGITKVEVEYINSQDTTAPTASGTTVNKAES